MKLITKEEEIPVKKTFQHRMRTMFRRMEVFVDGQFLGTLLLERPSHGREITVSGDVNLTVFGRCSLNGRVSDVNRQIMTKTAVSRGHTLEDI